MTEVANIPAATELTDIPPLTKEEAQRLTFNINSNIEHLARQFTIAYYGRAWEALGYAKWADYCVELRIPHLRLPEQANRELVSALKGTGLPFRVIEQVTGIPKSTAQRLTASPVPVPNGTRVRQPRHAETEILGKTVLENMGSNVWALSTVADEVVELGNDIDVVTAQTYVENIEHCIRSLTRLRELLKIRANSQ